MEYGLIGEKLGHSFSKAIHEKLESYTYELVELKKDELDFFLLSKQFKAINVTIPYKKDVIKYLNYIDDSVKKVNACNVIVNKNGKLYGYNSDYKGVISMLYYNKISLKDKKVAILGTGATCNTCYGVANSLEAKEIIKVSRNKKDDAITYEELLNKHLDVDVLINTTPFEMFPNNENSLLELDNFSNLTAVVDVIYNPLKTNLILKAEEKNIKATSGLYMLVAQAVFAIEYFLDKKFEEDIITKIYLEMLKEKENIVLIGMPSSGKTTIGNILAKRTHREFVDSDEEIIKRINMSIAEYIKLNGEPAFRDIEEEVIKEISLKQGCIISTGGGVILRKDNIRRLKQNGKLFFLDRSLSNLEVTSDRPLSSSREALKQRFEERYELYKKYADVIVNDDVSINDVANKIMEEF